MLNTKRGSVAATAAAADAQLRQQLEQAVQMNARPSSNINIERSSTSNHRAPLHPMASIANDMRYPSPSQTSHGLQMVPDGFMAGTLPEDGFPQHTEQSETRPNGDSAAKSFACGTCSKGFARRSDLARHGKQQVKVHAQSITDFPRTHTQWSPSSCLRSPRLWKAIHTEISPYCTCSCTYWREASHVREVWEGSSARSSLICLFTDYNTSLLATRAPLHGIAGYIPAKDHTNAHMQIARRLLPDVQR